MESKRVFVLFLVLMLLIAALGAFAVIAGGKAYRERPRILEQLPWSERIFGDSPGVQG